MRSIYITIIVTLMLFSCKKDNKEVAANYAYFGGEIINPYNNYIVLSKGDVVIDTIQLNAKNRFLYKIENLDPGLYTYHHGGEIQMVLLEPQDSLLLRLNTLEFDESLVYSGFGDKKNNYLIEEFLENEIQEKKIFKLCQLDPNKYSNRVDSIKNAKLAKFDKFISKYDSSPLFEEIALANINYNYYSSKEVYPFVHYGQNKWEILKSIPASFYDYRKDIDYNNALFKDYYYYNRFINHNVNNIALSEHMSHEANKQFDRASICYSLDRLNIIDSLITNQTLKDDLLYNFTLNFLSRSTDENNNNTILKSFIKKSKNEEDKAAINNYVASLNNLKQGNILPEIQIVDYKNNVFSLNSLIKKPTVISFWSHAYLDHFKDSHRKINELKIKYPDVNFIMINIDDNDILKIKNALKINNISLQNEYAFKDPDKSVVTLAVRPMTKTIIVDRHQKIVNSNSNMFTSNFEEQLLGAINR